MATFKGREIQILREPGPMDHKGRNDQYVVILTEDGEKTVSKGEVTIYSDEDVPVIKVTKEDKPLSEQELRVLYYKKATPKQIKQNNKHKDNKLAREQRMVQYHKDQLTPEEITSEENKFYASQRKAEVVKTPVVQNPNLRML